MESVVAGSAKHYAEALPSAPLRSHFRCKWTHRIPHDLAGNFIVVPDGCVDLLWIDGRLMVAGPDRSAAVEAIAPGSVVSGLRFQPAAAIKWLGVPMSEIVDRRVGLEELWGAEARRHADWIGEANTQAERIHRLEARLIRKAMTTEPADRDMAGVFGLLDGKVDSLVPSVADLVMRLDTSERTLRRRCREAFGYGPKTLDRVLRFQRFLALARRPGERRLAQWAVEAGYADQAHLAREVKRLSGLSPSAVIGQLAM
ncbi:helix-turn-helix domain-containing protein [Rhodospirillaceae bacterium SYSU D60014]|uniref:helix-turn-helix domain-containing protein n=1 Tax=Virgifigura deserti TaxID=2268457 RepID=UPI000E660C20